MMVAPVRPRIRDELWVKLWGNLAFNPISALTPGILRKVFEFPANGDGSSVELQTRQH